MYSAFSFGGAITRYPDVSSFITASGGQVTTSGSYKIHTFTSSGDFTITSIGPNDSLNTIEYLVVGGGGAGGCNNAIWGGGPGGGAGGVLTGSYIVSTSSLSINPVQVGQGGISGFLQAEQSYGTPQKGQNSRLFNLIAYGGGAGNNAGNNTKLTDGGSGAGGNYPYSGNGIAGQGNPGGGYDPPCDQYVGGGGGAGQAGQCGFQGPGVRGGGNGGNGILSSISGVSTYYGGGGGAGVRDVDGTPYSGSGGLGGGGNGGEGWGNLSDRIGKDGAPNTGGGGGGVGFFSNTAFQMTAGNGGSGIVIVKYQYTT